MVLLAVIQTDKNLDLENIINFNLVFCQNFSTNILKFIASQRSVLTWMLAAAKTQISTECPIFLNKFFACDVETIDWIQAD